MTNISFDSQFNPDKKMPDRSYASGYSNMYEYQGSVWENPEVNQANMYGNDNFWGTNPYQNANAENMNIWGAPQGNNMYMAGDTYTNNQTGSGMFSDAYEQGVNSQVDYSSSYQDIIDNFYSEVEKYEAEKQAEEARKQQEAQNNDKANDYANEYDSAVNGENGENTDGTSVGDSKDETSDVEESKDTTGETEEAKDTTTEGEESSDETPSDEAAAAESPYTEDELVEIDKLTNELLSATVDKSGTDNETFLDIMRTTDPKILAGVQANLQAQGENLYDIIRSETSGELEDVLEGYALAKIGGTTKESETALESYQQYAQMTPEERKNSSAYKSYINSCNRLFKKALNNNGAWFGTGTDEKVLTYILSLPDDILADVKKAYGSDFDKKASKEISGKIYDEFFDGDKIKKKNY